MVKVAMCAGHGGFGVTPGKRSPDGEYEWNFNDKVVDAALAKLKANGIDVLRTDDPTGHTDVSLQARTDKANAWGADAYVSFHHNANTGKWGTWTGTETFTYLGSRPESEKLAKAVHTRIVKVYGLKDRGLKKENFHIVRENTKHGIPSILCEGGYMDSTIDIKKLRDNGVLKAAGEAVADGIMAYFGITPKVAPKPEPTPAPKPAPNPTPKPAPTGIPVVGHIKIVGVKNAAIICDRPSTSTSKNLGLAKLGQTLPISGSIHDWFEVVYEGQRAYVNAKFGKRV